MGTRVIPLVIAKEKMELVRERAGGAPLCELLPYRLKTAGIVTTGNEVFYGRIQDTFTPVVRRKLEGYGIQTAEHLTVNDEKGRITAAILELKNRGCELIIATGGMSVDPDDQTPGAIKASGARVISYGAPVLPGAMFCLAYFEDGTPVMGLPGCVMYADTTIFDLCCRAWPRRSPSPGAILPGLETAACAWAARNAIFRPVGLVKSEI